jgi:hypothetical protein
MKDHRILPYVVEVMDKPEVLAAWAGLPSVVDTMRAFGLDEVIRCAQAEVDIKDI